MLMDISQLYNFIVTAEQQHMTKASEILAISQSALSRSIHSLEGELGVPLFERSKRKILLNEEGKQFLKDAKDIVNRVEISKEKLLDAYHSAKRNVSISYVHSLGLNYIPSLLKAFDQADRPHTLTLNEEKAPLIIRNLLTDKIDLGFATHFKPLEDLTYHPVFREKVVFITSVHHSFANRSSIDLDEIKKEAFIHYNKDTELRNLIDTNLFQRSSIPSIAYEGLEINSIIGLVSANMGVAFVPESTVEKLPDIKVVSIDGFELERTIYLIHKKKESHSGAVLSFKQFALDFLFL